MCGRYYRRSDKQRIAEAFKVGKLPSGFELAPDYNIAPDTFQPVIRPDFETGDRELVSMRWGMVPWFAKTEDEFKELSTINAKASRLQESNMWREPFKRRRCLVPADWFYEWPVVNGEKQARAFALKDGSPFAFAGIWDRWKDKDTNEILESFAIVTVEPSEWMAKYHDRMGVILKPKDYQRWLEEGEEHTLPLDLLRPYPEEEMQSWRVSDQVGNTRNNWAELIEPIPEETPKREKKAKHAKPKKELPPKGLFD